jgi:hypothetical protein
MSPSSGESWVRLPSGFTPTTTTESWFRESFHLEIRVESEGVWQFNTEEEYRGSGKPGIGLSLIARGTQFEPDGPARLEHLVSLTPTTSAEQLREIAEIRRMQLSLRSEDEPLWHRFVGELPLTLGPDLQRKLQDLQSHGDQADSLWLAECSPVLAKRLSFMRAFFAHRYTSEVLAGENFIGFQAARGLMPNSIAAFSLYLQPPLLLNSPWVGGYAAPRMYETFIRQLHQVEAG